MNRQARKVTFRDGRKVTLIVNLHESKSIAEGMINDMYQFRSLRWDELNEWFDHCASVFSSAEEKSYDLMRRYFMRHWYNDSTRKLDGIFVALSNGRIVSTVRVFHRYIYLNGSVVPMGGIGEVSTQPEHRRKGLSGRLLEMAIQYMEERGMAISALGTGVPQHYARYGWEPVAVFKSQVKLTAKRDLSVKVLDWDDPRELQQVISCYDRYAVQFNGMMVRDEYYWKRWVRSEAGRAWVLRSGDVVAYLMVKQQDSSNQLLVQDFAASTDEAESFQRLAAHAVDSFGFEQGTVQFPAAISTGCDGIKTHREDGKMYRLIGDSLKSQRHLSLEELLHKGSVNPDQTGLMLASIDGF